MNIRKSRLKSSGLWTAAVLLVAAIAFGGYNAAAIDVPTLTCDISDLRCNGKGKTCDIKFRNLTGLVENKGCESGKSTSSAADLEITARDPDGKQMGNAITIAAGKSNSINLDKKVKDGFLTIRVKAKGLVMPAASLACVDIREILEGNGTCKVYIDANPVTSGWVVLNCDQGNVCASSRWKWHLDHDHPDD